MDRIFSSTLRDDVAATVRRRAAVNTVIDVNAIAEEVRRRHLPENVALEDIAAMVMRTADHLGRPMVFEFGDAAHAGRPRAGFQAPRAADN